MRALSQTGEHRSVKKSFVGTDWFFGLLFSLVFLILAYVVFAGPFQGLERWGYDLGVRATDKAPSERVAVVAIDDQSINNLGRWPWPRTLQAQMIDMLAAGGAKAIGSTIFYSEPQRDPGLSYIDALTDQFLASSLVSDIPVEAETLGELIAELRPEGRNADLVVGLQALFSNSSLNNRLNAELEALAGQFVAAQDDLNADIKLSAATSRAQNVVQGMIFVQGQPQGRPDQPLPNYVQANALTNVVPSSLGDEPIPTLIGLPPIESVGQAAASLGYLATTLDVDGAQRFEPLVLKHFDAYYPSLALMLVAQALNLEPSDITLRLGESVNLGGLSIKTTPESLMYNYFYQDQNGAEPFPVDSFFDVLVGNIPAAKYKDKIVLIGASAAGVGDSVATPVAAAMPPVEVLAHTVSSILEEHFFVKPSWAMYAQLGVLLVIALWIILGVPRLRAGVAAMISLVLLIALIATEIGMMSAAATWLPLMIPAAFLVIGHVVMTIKRFRVTERLKISSDVQSAESNKMLGLAFQGQGQLDMAFDKFRKCPVDDGIMEVLYNLARDYEGKRQFAKSSSVYEYMAKHDPKYRDLAQKLQRSKKLEETVILGGGGGGGGGATLILDGDDTQKPMLGRYEVEKELGKGAMGTVYLGKDPKIGRVVAIKTMALQQEFEPDELEEVKERFFREAQTAGRLSHPNIVQIFDAGEEHDLAYIAMEFIKGHDLTKHVKSGSLMPMNEVAKVIADAADALDYAHAQNIVHRDIKPANMMWLPDDKIVKLMDFGIARITDASKTKTGMVLGTPSYMSPEQLAGKKVDGRSDLFSLTVTLYQLLTGELPFTGDSMATLMFKIANEEHTDASIIRPDIPPELDAIIKKGMEKDFDVRYARGRELSEALRSVIPTLPSSAA